MLRLETKAAMVEACNQGAEQVKNNHDDRMKTLRV